MNIEKILGKLDSNIEDMESKKIKVVSLKRKHFKKELSTTLGFGFQDMKKKPKKLFQSLMEQGYDVHTEPTNIANFEMDLYIILK